MHDHVVLDARAAVSLAFASLLAACAAPAGDKAPASGADGSLAFEPNLGQAAADVRFLARGEDYAVALTSRGLEARLPGRGAPGVAMTFAGADPAPEVSASGLLESTSHYFVGDDPAQWQPHVPQYTHVRYASLYPGIDAVFYGNAGNLEYDLVVAPGADPGAIALDFDGASALRIDASGDLVLGSGAGAPVQQRPIAYQVVDGARRLVDGAWQLLDADTVGFVLGAYDAALPLVIDPVLSYSSYIGGGMGDDILDVTFDSQGRTWVAGSTESSDFAGLDSGGSFSHAQGYACRFARPGARPSCVFVGGSGYDLVHALAIGADGSIHLAGSTRSADFPTHRAHQAAPGGATDIFVVRLDASMQVLEFGTFLGGTGDEHPRGLAVGGDGHTVVVGDTYSADFPVTTGAVQAAPDDPLDIAVASFAPDGHANFATRLGGGDYDLAGATAVARNGDILVTGSTLSSDFPVLGAFQSTNLGYRDAVLARLDGRDGRLLRSSYLGGPSSEHATAIRLARNGDIVLAGITGGDGFHAPRPVDGEPTDKAAGKGFVTRLTPAADAIVYNALLGNTFPPVTDMQLDRGDNVYVVGIHDYWYLDFEPEPWAIARIVVGGVTADGTRLLAQHAFEGAPSKETVCCIDVGIDGNVIFAGGSNSPIPLVAALQPWMHGEAGESTWEGFMAVFAEPSLRHWRGDFDGDGVDDILWRNDATGAGTLWYSADARSAVDITRVTNLDWRIAGVGDFDGDGRSDLLWRNARTGANTIWRSGDSRTSRATTGVTRLDWKVHAIGDFDGDGIDDIAWHDVANGETAIWFAADFARSTPLVRVTNLAWDIVGAGDFDGDGKDDLAWRHATTGQNTIWKGGDYHAQLDVDAVGGDWRMVGIADFQGDGRDDLVWRNMVDGRNVAWPGASRAEGQVLAAVARQWWQVAGTGDYDGDGKADLLWRDRVHGTNIIWRSASDASQRPVTGVTDQDWAPRS